jgi:hypothetical protein
LKWKECKKTIQIPSNRNVNRESSEVHRNNPQNNEKSVEIRDDNNNQEISPDDDSISTICFISTMLGRNLQAGDVTRVLQVRNHLNFYLSNSIFWLLF